MIHTLYFDENGQCYLLESETPRFEIHHYIDGIGDTTRRVGVRSATWVDGPSEVKYYVASYHPLTKQQFRKAIEELNPIPIKE